MKIECKLIRNGGTEVNLLGETVHFKPREEDGRHVAEVSKVIGQRLLAIEGYQEIDGTLDEQPPAVTEAEAEETAKTLADDFEQLGEGEGEGEGTEGEDETPTAPAVEVETPTAPAPAPVQQVKKAPAKKRAAARRRR